MNGAGRPGASGRAALADGGVAGVTAAVRRWSSSSRAGLRPFSDWDYGRPETELNIRI